MTSARCAGWQVAAREGRTWGVLWRRPGQRGSATAAPLRLAPHDEARSGLLAVHVLKRRGGALARPVLGRPGIALRRRRASAGAPATAAGHAEAPRSAHRRRPRGAVRSTPVRHRMRAIGVRAVIRAMGMNVMIGVERVLRL